jgi:pyruvate formate lyase activating enzyme
MNKALIFNIQRYSLNDGSGIRTMVFFKGCRLRCPWCSNPESQSMKTEIMVNKEKKEKYEKYIGNIDEDPTGAYEKVGKWYSKEELLREVLKDEVFFNTSNGGVTLSGGEVLEQGEFAAEFLKELKEHGINTAVETCGYGDGERFEDILKYTDTVLFDLKIMDNKKSKEILKGSSEIITGNFREASKTGRVTVRFPYIPGYTDDTENMEEIGKLMNECNVKKIDILPYHNYGSKKYEYLNRKYLLEDTQVPSDTETENIKKFFEKQGFIVNIGG